MNCSTGDEERLVDNDVVLCTAPPNPSTTHQDNDETSGTGVWSTVFLIVNATLGAGLLNFPRAFDEAGGLITSVGTQLIFLVFITAALVILANCSEVTDTSSMQDMFAALYGPKTLLLCASCIAIYSFGCCLTFLIIIGDQFDRVLATYIGPDYCHTWYLSRTFITVITCNLFLLPLCFFKKLRVLRYASSVGCVAVLYVTVVVVYKYFVRGDLPNVDPMKIWPDRNGFRMLQIIPIICFAYQSHMTAIPMYACMRERSVKKFTFCAVVSMIVCFLVYTIVGTFGYATFGSGKVPSDVLQGYADESVTVALAVVFVAIKNFTTYPIVLYCGRDALFSLARIDVDATTFRSRAFVTIVWYVLSLIIAVLVPDISPVVNLLGALSAAFIFVFPGIALFRSTLLKDSELYLNKDRLLVFFAIFITALGAFVSGLVFVEAIEDLNLPPKGTPQVTGFRRLRDSLCT
ncbi:putative sodium-coupled neutral amino acid transporter 7 [Ceratina calcarata]|uniref:Sodium-coupled neutral amino acid transporter 7 n=1 Tax=Ceratina calcarata TaxID=156304 RepID=A0AAJ7NA40_9HYME|nr:putative sodium-coupled neutral amino acid transporter 7 [Ceratina calcarata]